MAHTDRSYRGVESPSIFFQWPIAKCIAASKQRRGSNEARYGIIRGLKPFQMAIRPRRKDEIVRNE